MERIQEDLEQQLETVQDTLKAVKEEKEFLQAQIATVRYPRVDLVLHLFIWLHRSNSRI